MNKTFLYKTFDNFRKVYKIFKWADVQWTMFKMFNEQKKRKIILCSKLNLNDQWTFLNVQMNVYLNKNFFSRKKKVLFKKKNEQFFERSNFLLNIKFLFKKTFKWTFKHVHWPFKCNLKKKKKFRMFIEQRSMNVFERSNFFLNRFFFWTKLFFVQKIVQMTVQMNVQTCSLNKIEHLNVQWTNLNVHLNVQCSNCSLNVQKWLFFERSKVFIWTLLNTLNVVHWTKSLQTLGSQRGSRTLFQTN